MKKSERIRELEEQADKNHNALLFVAVYCFLVGYLLGKPKPQGG